MAVPRTDASTGIPQEEPTKRANGRDSNGDRIADRENEQASDAPISTQDVMEEIENLDFNPRGIEVLKVNLPG